MAGLITDALKFAGSVLSPAGSRARLSILIYHRVLPRADERTGGNPDARGFDLHMQTLARHFTPLPLSEAVERLKNNLLPERAACVTFDDGYADNAEVALPILQRHGIPATFFVATGYLNGGRMWNDTISEAVAQAKGDSLDLSALGLGVFPIPSAQARRAATHALLGKVKHLAPGVRAETTAAIAELFKVPPASNLMMRSDQVKLLHQAGMEIGGHTVTHPILLNLPDEAAEDEMANGKAQLEEIIGAPVTLFAYPNGKPGKDYGPQHAAMARRLGFAAAVSTTWGAARHGSDLFQLPRFTPWDATPHKFVLRLLQNYLR